MWGPKANAFVQESPDPLCLFELRRLVLGPLGPSTQMNLQTAPGKPWVPVRRLRLKLEDDPARPRRLVMVRGVGFRFDTGGDGTGS